MENTKPVILLVEDDPLLTKMYQTKFSMDGFDVRVAQDGEEGYQKIKEGGISFVIMDVMMPKLSGVDLYEKVRGEGIDIPTIFLTNLALEEQAKKVLSLGAKEYLIKANLTPKEIVDKIKTYLGLPLS
jgi:DNA-binding response OmpR family regulator